MHTALDIISLWPNRAELASDVGVDLTAVHAWVKRKRIAAEHYPAIVEAAQRRGIALSYEDLAKHLTASNARADDCGHFAHEGQAPRGLKRARAEDAA